MIDKLPIPTVLFSRLLMKVLLALMVILFASLNAAHAKEPANCQTAAECIDRGQRLFDGRGVKMDVDGARRHFAKGCEMDSAEACFALGRSYDGIVGEAKDSIPYYERACELGLIEACNNVSVYLSKYENPTEAELRRAIDVYTKLCDHDIAVGCQNLAQNYLKGEGVGLDEKKAEELLQKSCDLGGFCTINLMWKQPSEQIRPAAVKRLHDLDKECEQKQNPVVCELAATLHLKGDGVPRNEQRGIDILEKACDRGSAELCWEVGKLFVKGKLIAQNIHRGAEFLERGCELGKAYACLDMSDLLRVGVGLPEDKAAASVYVERACALGDIESCPQ
ncbi:tetratricopeptide repeat protein [Hyphomonas oceanitis]|nr:tetratricopeptide repeat protein [Hyphomonas oceanitis]